MNNPDKFLRKAKALVVLSENLGFHDDEIYVVWFAKTLGNWKALISTDKVPGLYWEVTYNGAKLESYVDRYEKKLNTSISDEYMAQLWS